MKYRLNIFTLASILLFFAACNSNTTPTEETPDSGIIEISTAQFQSENMNMSTPAFIPFADKLHFTGTIEPKANGKAIVSAPIAGIVKNILYSSGQQIKKGSPLIEISGFDIIDLQKNYAESTSTLLRLKAEYERSKSLYTENIGVKKDFMLTQNMYEVELARNNALKLKIQNTDLNADKIAHGEIFSSYTLKAPIDGFITEVGATVGQFVEPLSSLAVIINHSTLHLSIPIFGADVNKISTGQDIRFHAIGDEENILAAKISHTGKSIDPLTKAVRCFAHLETTINLVSNQFVEGDIILKTDSTLAIPSSAILTSENEHFVLILKAKTNKSYSFKKTKVISARSNKDQIEITDGISKSDKILGNGVYNIVIE